MRVVLDTNVVISAIFWRGPPHTILEACVEGRLRLVCSMEILDEYARVLSEPTFGASPEEVGYWTSLLLRLADFVVPAVIEPVVLADPSDDMFLACAMAGGAQAIVSGDKHLARLRAFEGIPIFSPRDFVEKGL